MSYKLEFVEEVIKMIKVCVVVDVLYMERMEPVECYRIGRSRRLRHIGSIKTW